MVVIRCECGGFIRYNFEILRRQCSKCKKLFGKIIYNKSKRELKVIGIGRNELGLFKFKDCNWRLK